MKYAWPNPDTRDPQRQVDRARERLTFRPVTNRLWLSLFASLALACGSPAPSSGGGGGATPADEQGEVVTPPFHVSGGVENLVLTWFDEEGPHTATSRSDIPAERRAEVRVDSLELPPEQRDPDHVFVADLRTADADGNYTVRRLSREAFEAHVSAFVAAAHAPSAGGGEDVIIYGASWCGACQEAQAYLRSRNIPFVEHDIEREPDARAEMQRRAHEAGISATSIPIIDFRGTIIQGFDREALDRAIRETSPDQAPGITI